MNMVETESFYLAECENTLIVGDHATRHPSAVKRLKTKVCADIKSAAATKNFGSLFDSGSKIFSVYVSKDYFKFNAAHFIAFKGYKERLHGHNYKVELRLSGRKGKDGYVVDFGEIKKVLREICKDINEHIILPMKSDVLQILECNESCNIQVKCENNSFYSFPKEDCKLLPIVHTSAEEIAEYILNKSMSKFSLEYLVNVRGVTWMEIGVAEAPNQVAVCRVEFPTNITAVKDGLLPTNAPEVKVKYETSSSGCCGMAHVEH